MRFLLALGTVRLFVMQPDRMEELELLNSLGVRSKNNWNVIVL